MPSKVVEEIVEDIDQPELGNVSLDDPAAADAALVARTVVRRLEPHGADTVATLALGPHDLSIRLPAHTPIGVGEPLAVVLDPAGIVWFDPETGQALC